MSKLMLIDGNSIINRAFYALPLLSNSKGTYTNAVYGFMNILLKFIDTDNPTHIAVAFDLKAPTFRHLKNKDYKGNRKGMPDELAKQLPILKELLKLMQIPIVELEGYEADDLLGTLAKRYEREKYDVIVVSGDRDLLQVASSNITIKIPKTKKGGTEVECYKEKDVIEKLGVTPTEFIDVKALMGDSSDNIKGIPGVGEKTAYKLIKEYKSLDNIYAHVEDMGTTKLVQKIIENKESAYESKFLATIKLDVPVEVEINEFKDCYNEQVASKLVELELRTVLERLKKNSSLDILSKKVDEINRVSETKYKFKKIEKKEEFLEEINKVKEEFIYKIFYKNKDIIAVSFLLEDTVIYAETSNLINDTDIEEELIIDKLKSIFETQLIRKIGYDIKKDLKTLISNGYDVCNYSDLMIAYYTYTLSNGPYYIENFANEILNLDFIDEYNIFANFSKSKKVKKQFTILDIDNKKVILDKYFNILESGIKKIEEIMDTEKQYLYQKIENPLVKVLAKMEAVGITIDSLELQNYSKFLTEKLCKLQSSIYKQVGYEFNINSPKQLGEALFVKLGLESKKKTKSGMSTSIDVLEKLSSEHPVINEIIEYRQFEKLRSTYTDGLCAYIGGDQKIHTTYNQTLTTTGRLSSEEPNLQNIPIRHEIGKKIRKAFIPKTGDYTFIDADYSQIELRVLAHMSEDEKLIEAYNSGVDIHTLTASQVFEVPIDKVTSLQRSEAKAVNFGIIYGISSFGLSNDINITKKQANEYIESYFSKYKQVKEYLERLVNDAEKTGISKTMFGRVRKIDELKSTNYMQREFGKRVAMNSPIQGTAADIMKIAMINIDNKLTEKKLDANILVQVHDELLVETNKSQLEEVEKIVKEEMENAVKLKIVLEANISIGDNWYDAK